MSVHETTSLDVNGVVSSRVSKLTYYTTFQENLPVLDGLEFTGDLKKVFLPSHKF